MVTNTLQAVSSLIQTLAWPLVALLMFYYFGPAINGILEELKEKTKSSDTASGRIGVFGLDVEYSLQKENAKAIMEVAKVQKGLSEPGPVSRKPHEGIKRSIDHELVEKLSTASVLWVDDDPSNNVLERLSLETLGVAVTTVETTDEALEQLRTVDYDVVVSDMGRSGNDHAGYDLLEEMQKAGNDVPFVIYAGEWSREFVRETRRKGGFGNTNDPQVLLELVQSALFYPTHQRHVS